MPATPPASPGSLRLFWPVALPVAVAFAYACGHLNWYLGTPLGRVPVLDERENLDLAGAILGGTLPAEPFYRMPGYALGLATLRALGVAARGLFPVALMLGAVLHALNAGLVARIAHRWLGAGAAFAAGLLAALHPVFVHFATQALDATPALALFLLGLNFLAPAFTVPANAGRWFRASACWAAATLLRPNYLLVWAALPLLAATKKLPGSRWPRTLGACGGAVLFVALAAWQWRVCGAPAFWPAQGAYNFWAANQPGAHGRYYVQRLSLPPALARENPARAESLLLFAQETGQATADLAAANAYWQRRAVAEISAHPFAWLGRLARKTYALLNDWEQYNNKTFAFHQVRSPWLRWNPLSWGVLLVLGVAGAARLFAVAPWAAELLALLCATVAVSVLLIFVSARFRLPLAALLCIAAGGALAAPGFWWAWPRSRQLALAGALLATGIVTFSNFDRVRDPATFVQDHALLARAAATVGDDALASAEAHAALALQPRHPDALRIAVAAGFNQLLADTLPPSLVARWSAACRQLLVTPTDDAPDLRAVAALALWRAGEKTAALTEWQRLSATPSALAARALAGDASVTRVDLANLPASAWTQPLVPLAAATLRVSPPVGAIFEPPANPAASAARIFSPPPLP